MPEELLPNVVGSPAIYVTRQDNLLVTAYNTLAGLDVTLRTRTLSPNGEITPGEFTFTPTADRTFQVMRPDLSVGWLLSVLAIPSLATLKQGACYVTIGLQRNVPGQFDAFEILAQGYLTSSNFIAWPKADSRTPTEGAGRLFSESIANPGANTNFSYTVPANTRQKIHNLYFTFTEVGGVNATPLLWILPNGAQYGYYLFTTVVVNAATHTYTYAISTNTWVYNAGLYSVCWLPDVVLPAGAVIQSSVSGMGGGDNFTNILLFIEEWLEE